MTNNEACLTSPLADVAFYILEEWKLTPDQVRDLAADLPGEYEAYYDEANEAAWDVMYDLETLANREASHAAQLVAAGRGHLVKP